MDYSRYFTNAEIEKNFNEFLAAKTTEEKEFFRRKTKERFEAKSDEEKKAYIEASKDSLKIVSEDVEEMKLSLILSKIMDYVSLSYIAGRYFNRSRYWLYHRLKGNIVNGKPAKFTNNEKKIFSKALQEISREIYDTSLRIS